MNICLCYQPVKVYLRDTTDDRLSTPEPPKKQPLQDLSGKFVIVTYDELPYVGQVLEVVGEEVQVTSMRQSGDNVPVATSARHYILLQERCSLCHCRT